VGLADFLEEHWLLLPAAAPGDESLLRDLLEAAMPPIDADGRGVVSLHSGPPPQALLDVGFQLLPSPVTGGSAALRPSLPSPVAV
jgi:hypothetical protein